MNNNGRGFQEDLQMIIKGLNNPNRQEIIKVLREETGLSFSQIKERTKIKGSLLSNHLNNLIENLLVERYYDHYSEKNTYSYYELTSLGKRMVNAIEAAFYNVPQIIETTFVRTVSRGVPGYAGEEMMPPGTMRTAQSTDDIAQEIEVLTN